jgi:hypothetical protein
MTAIPAEKLDKLVQRWTSLQSELSQSVNQATRCSWQRSSLS